MFITQAPKPAVEKAHLHQRRPRDIQDAVGLVTSILQIQCARAAQKRPKYVKKKSKKKIKMRKTKWYSFGFLPWIYNKRSAKRKNRKRRRQTRLNAYYNAKLHVRVPSTSLISVLPTRFICLKIIIIIIIIIII